MCVCVCLCISECIYLCLDMWSVKNVNFYARISCIFNKIHTQELISSILIFSLDITLESERSSVVLSEIWYLFLIFWRGIGRKRTLDQRSQSMWSKYVVILNFSFGTKSLNNFYIILFLNHCLFRSLGVIGFKNRFYTPVSKLLCIFFFHIGKPLSIWFPLGHTGRLSLGQWYKSQCSTSQYGFV